MTETKMKTEDRFTIRRVKRKHKSIIRKVYIMGVAGKSIYSRKECTRPIEFAITHADYDGLNDNVRLEKDATVIFDWLFSLPSGTYTKLHEKMKRFKP